MEKADQGNTACSFISQDFPDKVINEVNSLHANYSFLIVQNQQSVVVSITTVAGILSEFQTISILNKAPRFVEPHQNQKGLHRSQIRNSKFSASGQRINPSVRLSLICILYQGV